MRELLPYNDYRINVNYKMWPDSKDAYRIIFRAVTCHCCLFNLPGFRSPVATLLVVLNNLHVQHAAVGSCSFFVFWQTSTDFEDTGMVVSWQRLLPRRRHGECAHCSKFASGLFRSGRAQAEVLLFLFDLLVIDRFRAIWNYFLNAEEKHRLD